MRRFLLSGAAVTALGVSATAMGQVSYPGTSYTPVNITVKAGVGVPLDSNLSNVVTNFVAVGAEFQLPTPLIRGGDTYFSLDYFTKSFSGTPSFVNLSINQRYYIGTSSEKALGHRKWAFIGAGMDFMNITTSDNVFAARAGLGAELGENIFAEVAGYVSDKSSDGIHADVAAFFIGYRF
jgi:hypothetical protein